MNNGKICVSVCAKTATEFIEKIERAAEVADVIELRFDCLEKSEFETVLAKIESLKQKIQKPFLATFRPKSRDAQFILGKRIFSSAEEENRIIEAIKERKVGWEKILSSKGIDWVDFEEDLQINLLIYDMAQAWEAESNTTFHKELSDNLKKRKIIFSEHYFDNIPENLVQIYKNLISNEEDKIKCDVIKIAVQANGATDGLAVMKLLERAKTDNKDIIPIAMGESGVWTRILGLSRGAFMTFASLDETGATAPGQLTVQEMIDVYRVKKLDENTEIYGLVAESVIHSVSPQMHNAAFKYHNLNAVYVPFAVKNLDEFMRRMVNPKTREIDWKLRGLSVTNPHKVEMMKYLDFVDKTAQKIGAVNTVKITEAGELHGFNTDAQGFIEPLKTTYGDIKNCKVAVLGAGGAARACVYALKQEGAEVTIFARNLAKAETLATEFDVAFAQLDEEVDFKPFNILVNATPLGTKKGGLENEAPAKTLQLGGLNLLYDLVYNPQTTKLMREAQAVFVPTLGGLSMLVAQAMIQQKIWTGLDAPMKEMGAAALRKLQE